MLSSFLKKSSSLNEKDLKTKKEREYEIYGIDQKVFCYRDKYYEYDGMNWQLKKEKIIEFFTNYLCEVKNYNIHILNTYAYFSSQYNDALGNNSLYCQKCSKEQFTIELNKFIEKYNGLENARIAFFKQVKKRHLEGQVKVREEELNKNLGNLERKKTLIKKIDNR